MSSLLPLISDLLNESRRPLTYGDLFDQHFGLGLYNDAALHPSHSLLMNPAYRGYPTPSRYTGNNFGVVSDGNKYRITPARSGYLRPWRSMGISDSGISTISADKNEFKVNLDVQQFKPEELKVKVLDGFIVVEGKHEERSDEHGFIARQFTRKYKIPETVNQESITSNLSSDGVLTLKAPMKVTPEATGREIPITQSQQPAVKKSDEKKTDENMEQ